MLLYSFVPATAGLLIAVSNVLDICIAPAMKLVLELTLKYIPVSEILLFKCIINILTQNHIFSFYF